MDDETLAVARRLFDLAREGRAEQLAGCVDAGVPVDLTDDEGDTLLLLAAGADPRRGAPDAVATARSSELHEMVELLARARP